MSDVAKVKYTEDEPHTVPRLGGRLVLPGQVVEVPVEDVYGYTLQTERWVPYDTAAKKAHKQAVDELDARLAAEAADLETRFGPAEPGSTDEPADSVDSTPSPQED